MSAPLRTHAQDLALAACERTIAGSEELLRFATHGPALPPDPWADMTGGDPVVNLADAARLAIAVQGGPKDAQERALLAALLTFLEPCGVIGAEPGGEIDASEVAA